MRVPVAVEDDDRVCALQIEAETARARWQQEYEVFGVRVVEFLQELTTIFGFRHTVQPVTRMALQGAEQWSSGHYE